MRGRLGVISLVAELHRHAVHSKYHVVIHGLVRRQGEAESDVLLLAAVVLEPVFAGEGHFVSAVPQQSLLAMLQLEPDIGPSGCKRQHDVANKRLAGLPGSGWRRLHLRRTPRGRYPGSEPFVLAVSTLKDGLTQDHPTDGGR